MLFFDRCINANIKEEFTMKEQLLEILKDIRPEVDFENEKGLVTDGILDSFSIVTLVGRINEEFDITVGVDELEPENFDSVDAMIELIKKLAD